MLDKYISALGNSLLIFKLSVSHKKDTIHSDLVEEVQHIPDENDPISRLVCDRFTESLGYDRFDTDHQHIKKAVLQDIKREFQRFIDAHGGYKNAKQSAIFRFMGAYGTPEPLVDGLVYLYRYSKSLGMTIHGSFPVGVDQKHIDNILAIIELMRSKFEQGS